MAVPRFTLQGAFGAWLMSQWTPRAWLQATGAAFFVMAPALLIRIGHPSPVRTGCCSGPWRSPSATANVRCARSRAALGLVAGLVILYLAVMARALLTAVVVRPSATAWPRKAASLAGAAGATIAGWWAAGLFSVSGAEAMATEGLGHYSINLFSPITQAGGRNSPSLHSARHRGAGFRRVPVSGLGGLLLLIAAVVVRLSGAGRDVPAPPAGRPWQGFGAPLFLIALLMAMFALSPRVTAAGGLLVDLSGPWAERFAVFRATGRFFWPLGYLLMASALATIATRLPSRVALTVLLTLVIVQALDLHGAHGAPPWRPRSELLRVGQPDGVPGVGTGIACIQSPGDLSATTVCPAPIAGEPAAYQAGLHGLTLNAGGVARPDDAARLAYCHDLGEQVKAGRLDPQSLYIVPPSEVGAIRQAAQPPAVCGSIDTVSVW